MTKTVGIRDISRNSNILQGYDYIDIEDKKTHEYKGLFVSPKFANDIKKYLEKKISQEKQNEFDEIMQFSGILNGETKNMTSQEIKAAKKDKYDDK